MKTIQQAAGIWCISSDTVRRLVRVGLIETVRVGQRRLIADDEIKRIIARGIPSPQAYAACCKWLAADTGRRS
jgi:excisionase family DNA binding protein